MFSHITVGVSSLDRAATFYDALLLPLGLIQRAVTPDGGPPSRCWIDPEHVFPRFYAYIPFNGEEATAGNGTMVAFLAPSEQAVIDAFSRAMAAGGSSEGEPGERLQYAAGYFGAYLRDPDGNKIHVVYRGDQPV